MEMQDFESYYASLADDQLLDVLADKQDLIPEASIALEREVHKRSLTARHIKWLRDPNSIEEVRSLDDYPDYRKLVERLTRLSRFWYLRAMSLFILVLILSKLTARDYPAFVLISLGWACFYVIVLLYWRFRLLSVVCPQCGKRFGRGSECFNCGFPRSLSNSNN